MQSLKQICERGTFFNVRYTKRVIILNQETLSHYVYYLISYFIIFLPTTIRTCVPYVHVAAPLLFSDHLA